MKIEFGKGSWPALDEATIDGALPASFIDGYQDEQGVYFKRPGKTKLNSGTGDPAAPVQGIFWSVGLQCFIIVAKGILYKMTAAGVVTAITGDDVPTTVPATFAENGTTVYVTAGGKMVKTDGTTGAEETDAVAPTSVTHLTWLDSHIIANEVGTGRFWWTDAGAASWGATNYADANAAIDKIVALASLTRELYLFGTHSTEIWYNTGQTPATFQRQEGAYIERGCSAPYSVVKADNTLFWLDHERNFVKLVGRNPQSVSGPVNKILRELSSVADVVASTFQHLNQHFIMLSSSTNNLTLIYDYVLDSWFKWGVWSPTTFTYDKWGIFSFCFSPENNLYVGLDYDTEVYTIGAEATDARFMLRTAHMSFGTYARKFFTKMEIRAKRGYVTTATTPVFTLRWRNDNKVWSQPRYLSLNATGDFDNVVEAHRLGSAKTRQFEFVQSDTAPFAIVGVDLEMDVEE